MGTITMTIANVFRRALRRPNEVPRRPEPQPSQIPRKKDVTVDLIEARMRRLRRSQP